MMSRQRQANGCVTGFKRDARLKVERQVGICRTVVFDEISNVFGDQPERQFVLRVSPDTAKIG